VLCVQTLKRTVSFGRRFWSAMAGGVNPVAYYEISRYTISSFVVTWVKIPKRT